MSKKDTKKPVLFQIREFSSGLRNPRIPQGMTRKRRGSAHLWFELSSPVMLHLFILLSRTA